MNKNSFISRFIEKNWNWENILEEKKISVKQDDIYYIFNYREDADFFDPIVQEARGIIIEKDTLDVACWPFRKFGNYGEEYADDIDWKTARVQEKIDGSIIKLFFNRYSGVWQWATNGTITAKKAPSPYNSLITFMDLIELCDNYHDVDTDKLDKNTTYIFELVGPSNKIVINYKQAHLYHIGTRNNLTGKESNVDIGIEKPGEYGLHSFEECIEAAKALNPDGVTRHEGFVVVDDNYHRVKIKTPEYVAVHHYANGIVGKSKLLEIIQDEDFNKEDFCSVFPHYKEPVEHYLRQMEQVREDVKEAVEKARVRYKELGENRKEFAKEFLNTKYGFIAFKAIGNQKGYEELLREIPKAKYENLIEDY